MSNQNEVYLVVPPNKAGVNFAGTRYSTEKEAREAAIEKMKTAPAKHLNGLLILGPVGHIDIKYEITEKKIK